MTCILQKLANLFPELKIPYILQKMPNLFPELNINSIFKKMIQAIL